MTPADEDRVAAVTDQARAMFEDLEDEASLDACLLAAALLNL